MKRRVLVACVFILASALTARVAGYENTAGIFQLDVGGRPAGLAGAFLAQFTAQVIKSGFMAKAIQEAGVHGAAPPGN